MFFQLTALLLATGLFAGLLGSYSIGRRMRLRRLSADSDDLPGAGIVEGAVFTLLGLILAFSFAGAASRFDERRHLIVEEANAIGTAYLRLDLLAPAARDEMRASFRTYLDSRLAVYRALPDIDAAKAGLARSSELQQQIWTRAVHATTGSQPATMLLLPALNDMFDITTTRTMATWSHPPWVIFVLLLVLCLLGAFIAGHAMGTAKRSRLYAMTFAGSLAIVVYVIIDLEFPRLGFIRVDDFDRVLVDLLQSMR